MEIGFHHTTGTAEGPAAGTAVCGYVVCNQLFPEDALGFLVDKAIQFVPESLQFGDVVRTGILRVRRPGILEIRVPAVASEDLVEKAHRHVPFLHDAHEHEALAQSLGCCQGIGLLELSTLWHRVHRLRTRQLAGHQTCNPFRIGGHVGVSRGPVVEPRIVVGAQNPLFRLPHHGDQVAFVGTIAASNALVGLGGRVALEPALVAHLRTFMPEVPLEALGQDVRIHFISPIQIWTKARRVDNGIQEGSATLWDVQKLQWLRGPQRWRHRQRRVCRRQREV
mmetsp:Transcript_77846/g.158329  ORF Transcript_77846/g.158329 Transcript_77846/m.158329 type:complete len:280 (-) Transcript_77846:144-983(-)